MADAALALGSNDVAEYPNPDLAIEVDVTPTRIDRAGIYAALKVSEIWRFDSEQERIVFDQLAEDGSYKTAVLSKFLPVTSVEVSRWVLEEDRSAGAGWARRLRDWTRAELAPRVAL